MRIQVLVLAAGVVQERQESYPICLTEIQGEALIEKICHKLTALEANNVVRYNFALKAEEIRDYYLDNVMRQLVKNPNIITIPEHTQGSACTALFGACQFDPENEVLIISTNEYSDIDYAESLANFRQRGLDAATFIFKSIHPRYSYVKLNEQQEVIEASQQNPISQHATTGTFWFKRAGDLVEGIQSMIRNNVNTDGLFYLAPVFNELILKQKKIGVQPIEISQYNPLKSETQRQQAIMNGID